MFHIDSVHSQVSCLVIGNLQHSEYMGERAKKKIYDILSTCPWILHRGLSCCNRIHRWLGSIAKSRILKQPSHSCPRAVDLFSISVLIRSLGSFWRKCPCDTTSTNRFWLQYYCPTLTGNRRCLLSDYNGRRLEQVLRSLPWSRVA